MTSVGGIITLIFIVVVGPLIFLIKGLLFPAKPNDEEVDKSYQTTSTDREETDTTAYLMSLLGYAIGIGNLWRFPYLVGKWGGGAFVLAYVVCLFLVSMPLFLVELAVGHQTRKSTPDCLKSVHPRWEALGFAQGLMIFVVSTFFNVLIAYAMVYVGASLIDPLPWAGNGTEAEDFWKQTVLNEWPKEEGIPGLGGVQWNLTLGLLVVHIMNFLAISFGKDVLAKVTYVTVIGPVILLAILLFQTTRLPGAWDGITFYVGRFDTTQLVNPELWSTACSQILFSLSPGFGTAITMSSTTPPHTDVYRTCLIVGLANSAFSITGGFAIFSILGNLAYRTGGDVFTLAQGGGPGLAFIAIADGMETFAPYSNVMSVLFFVMLVSLGLDSSFAWIETVVVIVTDKTRERGMTITRNQVTAIVCVLLFFLGIPYCTRAGNKILDVVDHFNGSLFLLFACCVEAFIFNTGYGWPRMAKGMEAATGRAPFLGSVWNLIIYVTMPIGPCGLFIYLLVSDIMNPYGGYPAWLLIIGWTSFLMCVILAGLTLHKQGESTLDAVEETKDVELIKQDS